MNDNGMGVRERGTKQPKAARQAKKSTNNSFFMKMNWGCFRGGGSTHHFIHQSTSLIHKFIPFHSTNLFIKLN